jgi:PPIC-type PPIASE domain
MSRRSPEQRSTAIARLTEALKDHPQRLSLLFGIGAASGAIIAGLALFRAAPTSISIVPPGYVALVNQKGILTSDFDTLLNTETGKGSADASAAERSKALREMVDEELLVQRALALDLPETTTEVRETMADAVNTQAAAPALGQEPTDDELRSFYELHQADYAATGLMTVRDLVLHVGGYQNADQSVAQAETDAAEAVYQLRSGASIDYIMNHYGLVDSGRMDNAEQLDFAAKLHLGTVLYQIAASLSDGQISDPVVANDGVHVLIMDRRVPPRVADFASIRMRVYDDYRQSQTRAADARNLSVLRREARILLLPGLSE